MELELETVLGTTGPPEEDLSLVVGVAATGPGVVVTGTGAGVLDPWGDLPEVGVEMELAEVDAG